MQNTHLPYDTSAWWILVTTGLLPFWVSLLFPLFLLLFPHVLEHHGSSDPREWTFRDPVLIELRRAILQVEVEAVEAQVKASHLQSTLWRVRCLARAATAVETIGL